MKSMTGMGRAQGPVGESHFRIEIRSINHRYCEVNFRSPARLASLEMNFVALIKKHVARGKIDVSLFEERTPEASITDQKAYALYYNYLKNIQTQTQIPGTLEISDLLSGVGAWIQKETDTTTLLAPLTALLESALKDHNQMRVAEGLHLKNTLVASLQNLSELKNKIHHMSLNSEAEIENSLREKITTKLKDFDKLDPARLHTEVLYYLDRLDITEELDRLDSHIKQMQHFLNQKEPMGRKIDFLLQEFNREFNTISSKSQDAAMAHFVVEAKAELEKMREQIQNIE